MRYLRPKKHAVQALGPYWSQGPVVFHWHLCVLSYHLSLDKDNITSSTPGLTIGSKVGGDPAKDIIKVAFENGINMFDTAEVYGRGGAEFELWVSIVFSRDTSDDSL